MDNQKEEGTPQALIVGGVVAAAGTVLGMLLSAKPAEAAPPKEQWDYLLKCQETIIDLLEQLIDAAGAPVPVEVTVSTPWVAKEPEQIFDQAIRNAGTFTSDKMVDYRNAKRLSIKVESSLDQACIIQPIGNFSDSFLLPTNIGPPLPCVANGNISVGFAWDDWHPFIGVTITTAIAPTTGILKIWAVIQE